jgi:hypothetical protein
VIGAVVRFGGSGYLGCGDTAPAFTDASGAGEMKVLRGFRFFFF